MMLDQRGFRCCRALSRGKLNTGRHAPNSARVRFCAYRSGDMGSVAVSVVRVGSIGTVRTKPTVVETFKDGPNRFPYR